MTRKLDKEHLEKIQTLRDEFAKITSIVGNIAIEEIVLKRQLTNLEQEREQFINQITDLQQQEQQLIEKMRARYGEGQINIAEGTFTPDAGLPK